MDVHRVGDLYIEEEWDEEPKGMRFTLVKASEGRAAATALETRDLWLLLKFLINAILNKTKLIEDRKDRDLLKDLFSAKGEEVEVKGLYLSVKDWQLKIGGLKSKVNGAQLIEVASAIVGFFKELCEIRGERALSKALELAKFLSEKKEASEEELRDLEGLLKEGEYARGMLYVLTIIEGILDKAIEEVYVPSYEGIKLIMADKEGIEKLLTS